MTGAELLLADLAGSMPGDVQNTLRRRARIRTRVERAADRRWFAVMSATSPSRVALLNVFLAGWARLELRERFPVGGEP